MTLKQDHASQKLTENGLRPDGGALTADTNPVSNLDSDKIPVTRQNTDQGTLNTGGTTRQEVQNKGLGSLNGGTFNNPGRKTTETGEGHNTNTPVSIDGSEQKQVSPLESVKESSQKEKVTSNPVQRPQSQSVAPQVPDSLQQRVGGQITQNASGGYNTGTHVQFSDRSQPPVIEPKVNTGNADLPYRREDGNVVYPAGNITLPSREAGSTEKNSVRIVETENGYATVKEDGSLDPIFERHPAGREVTSGSGQASSPQIAERSSGGRHKKVTPKDNPKHGRKRH